MPELTALQKNQLIQREPHLGVGKIVEYIQKFDNLSLYDFPKMDKSRRVLVEQQLRELPNPNEQSEWQAISALLATPSTGTIDKLNIYINNWKNSRPKDNHVDEALKIVQEIQAVIDRENVAKEQDDWSVVDTLNIGSLTGHLCKYPNSVHKSEIDDSIWGLTNKESVQEVQNYISLFPSGKHVQDANGIIDAIALWDSVKNSEDIFLVNEYLLSNPNSPFMHQALILMTRLKQQEFAMMKSDPNTYEVSRLMRIINEKIATDRELINAKVMTENILHTLRQTDITADLPDIRKAIADSTPECKDGYTDVFFFGVPSTGKTCILMGLTRSDSLHVNLASGGGDYAAALQQYTDAGITVPATPCKFVTTLEAAVSPYEDGTIHRINLVEMSGEEFAFDIANNPDHVFTFEDMGSGATQLLKNDNRKVFFLIIDPTANVVRINREIVDEFDEETGAPISVHLESCVVNQRTIIQKMVDMMMRVDNGDIMKKVDAIHIILTKSDTLGSSVDREDRAEKIFNNKFRGVILSTLVEMCKEYNINLKYNFRPKLYTFSLGQFYVGGLYEYDSTDSNKLVRAILNCTPGIRRRTFWDRLKEKIN